MRTVREFEAAGVASITLEDQVSPKKCPAVSDQTDVVPLDEAVAKIRAAVAARRDPDLVIIARPDARDPAKATRRGPGLRGGRRRRREAHLEVLRLARGAARAQARLPSAARHLGHRVRRVRRSSAWSGRISSASIAPMDPRDGSAGGVARAFRILAHFERVQRPCRIGELAGACNLPRSTAALIASQLVKLGLLSHDRSSRTYMPTLRLAELGRWVENQVPGEDRERLVPLLTALAARLEETVVLALRNDLYPQYIHVAEGARDRRGAGRARRRIGSPCGARPARPVVGARDPRWRRDRRCPT